MTSADVVAAPPRAPLPHRTVALLGDAGQVRPAPARSRRPRPARAGRGRRRPRAGRRRAPSVAVGQVDRLPVEAVACRLPVRRAQRVTARAAPRSSPRRSIVQCRHHAGPDQRGEQHRLGHRGGHVGDAHLDGREVGRRADVPIDHAVVEHRAGVHAASAHHRVVLVDGVEVRRRARAGPARPQHASPAGVAGVGVAVDRRVGGQRQQQRQPRPQPVAHPDRRLAVGHRDVHVTAADALLVGDHAEPVGDLAGNAGCR